MMIFACLVVVSLIMCNDFSRQGRLVAWRGRGLRGSVSEVWTAGHGGVKGRGRGRANLSLWALCVLLICVLCEKKNVFEIRWGVFSLTELTDLTEPFCAKFNSWGILSHTDLTDLTEHICAQFWTHRTPPAYRYHRTLLPKMAVRFCEIGWLNVSVGLCVFCSSVFFCERKKGPSWEI